MKMSFMQKSQVSPMQKSQNQNGMQTLIGLQYISISAASWQNQQNECAPSEDSDQPGHPPSLIRVFPVRSMGS